MRNGEISRLWVRIAVDKRKFDIDGRAENSSRKYMAGIDHRK